MNAEQSSGLVERLRTRFAAGSPVAGQGTVVDLREASDEVVLLVRWDRDPHLYGIPIPLTDTRHEFFYSDCEVTSDEEWLDSVGIGLMVMLDTGHRATARRRQVGDYIELRDLGGWPVDDRFYLQEGGFEVDSEADRLRRDGLDPAIAIERRDSHQLLVWLFSYENNSAGGPWVGHAVVSRAGAAEAVLDYVETSPGVPETVRLDLAYFACHAAAKAGIQRVRTSIGDEVLSLAGFRFAPDGTRTLDTSFLDADPEGARALLAVDLTRQSHWGRDRDLAGRYLPTSRAGRALHLLRYGRSGGKPRMRAG